MDAVLFNPFNAPKPDAVKMQISDLKELTLML
jgi:putative hydrolase of the HAD superfamily